MESDVDLLSAVMRRDPAADNRCWYGVASTGIYCRPSCPSRRPLPRHVRLFPSCDAAEAAGFRPCKRCCPRLPGGADAELADRLRAARRYLIQHAAAGIDWRDGAAAAFLSPSRFHRLFRAAFGETPARFLARRRAIRVLSLLRKEAGTVSQAALEAGFGSVAACYRAFTALYGASPGTLGRGRLNATTETRRH